MRKIKNLKLLREQADLSVKEISVALDVSPQAVGKWERGEACPRAELLPKLADLLHCTIDALFGRDTA